MKRKLIDIGGKENFCCENEANQELKRVKINEEEAICKFCKDDKDDPKELSLANGKSILAHEECLLWCPEVYQDKDLKWVDVPKALRKYKSKKCSHCKKDGATITCKEDKCKNTYHYPCAVANCASMDDLKFTLTCRTCAPSDTNCFKCHKDGYLICCDGCDKVFHLQCVNLESPPEGDWFCNLESCSQGTSSAKKAAKRKKSAKKNETVSKPTNTTSTNPVITPPPPPEGGYKNGDVIEARFQGKEDWYKGVISKVHSTGSYDILYDDGDSERNVKEKLIRVHVDILVTLSEDILPLTFNFPDLDPAKELVELFCVSTIKWYPAKCVEEQPDKYFMHFQGWDSKYDQWISKSEMRRFAPIGTHTKKKKAPLTREEYLERARQQAEDDRKKIAEQNALLEYPGVEVIESVTKTGRIVKTIVNPHLTYARNVEPREHVERDRNEEICATCEKYNTFDGDQLVCCEGPCLRVFHVSCLGLDDVPVEDEWFCKDCQEGAHNCFYCKVKSQDGTEDGVFKCSQSNCGRHFHEACLSKLPLTSFITDKGEKMKFKCASHVCNVCNTTAKEKGSKVIACLRCTLSYHQSCIPPSAVYNEYNLHCPEHANIPLPFETVDMYEGVDLGELLGLSIDTKLLVPNCEPTIEQARNTNHFRLPFQLKAELETKPPSFKSIRKNVWLVPQPDHKSKDKEDPVQCDCTETCGKSCVNYILNLECDISNCRVSKESKESKVDCGNRRISKKQWITNTPYQVWGAGWALKTDEDLEEGQFVMEYQGEIYDENIYEERMAAYKERGEINYYVMKYGKDLYIDAAHEGNMSRFMNHSCDPNCVTETWKVNGESRIAFRTLRAIHKGEELTYDYQFISSERIECHCGAHNCKRFLGNDAVKEEKDNEKNKVMTALMSGNIAQVKKQFTAKELNLMKSKAQAFRKRKSEKMEKEEKEDICRLSLTRASVPGDNSQEISKGPLLKHKQPGLFLWRNVLQGNHFLERLEKMKKSCTVKSDAKIIKK